MKGWFFITFCAPSGNLPCAVFTMLVSLGWCVIWCMNVNEPFIHVTYTPRDR